MKQKLSTIILLAAMIMSIMPTSAQTDCSNIPLPYYEDFYSDSGTLPDCWVYDENYIGWNNWPETSGDGELMFKEYSAGYPAVLPLFAGSPINKLEISFKTKCGTIAEGDAILIGVADVDGNLLNWIDTITSPDHSRNAWVAHTYNFLRYSGNGMRIALGRLWNSTGDHWVAIDSVSVRALSDCTPADSLQAHNLAYPDDISFSWVSFNSPLFWQVYCDTVTVDIDTVAEERLQVVSTTSYTLPSGTVQGGGKYKFFVRGNCNNSVSNWVSYEFGAGTVIMNNTGMTEHVTGCGLVVYDNGGPIAGYLDNSNSLLVVHPENGGDQLKVFGAMFGFGMSGVNLSIYDGAGTTGTVLYSIATSNFSATYDSILATSTQGALTIKFTCDGNYTHTGYELYIRCTSEPSCPKPTSVAASNIGATSATIGWNGNASSYNVRYRVQGTDNWSLQTSTTNTCNLTNLMEGTVYEAYIEAVCSSSDVSTPSVTIQFTTLMTDCPDVTNLSVTGITDTLARISWVSAASSWEVQLDNQVFITTECPYLITGLTPNSTHTVKVRSICSNNRYSEWSNVCQFTTTGTQQGISDVESYLPVAIYPNPTNGITTITFDGAVADVDVVDVTGRVVLSIGKREGSTAIDFSTMNEGVYYIRLKSADSVVVRKVVVSK